MMKHIKKLFISVLLLIVTISMSSFVFAASNDDQMTNPNAVINYPTLYTTYYKGETIKYSVRVTNPWSYYWCKPFFAIMNLDTTALIQPFGEGNYMAAGKTTVWTGKLKTTGFPLGKGNFAFMCTVMPIYPGTTTEVGYGNQVTVGNKIKIRAFKAPTAVKAKAGKKKVTVSFKKATGAKKYYVFRSTKKSSGFKRVGTTKTTKFVDKKVKKGKRYYYKVKSVRNVHGNIKSPYSAVKRSAKVK